MKARIERLFGAWGWPAIATAGAMLAVAAAVWAAVCALPPPPPVAAQESTPSPASTPHIYVGYQGSEYDASADDRRIYLIGDNSDPVWGQTISVEWTEIQPAGGVLNRTATFRPQMSGWNCEGCVTLSGIGARNWRMRVKAAAGEQGPSGNQGPSGQQQAPWAITQMRFGIGEQWTEWIPNNNFMGTYDGPSLPAPSDTAKNHYDALLAIGLVVRPPGRYDQYPPVDTGASQPDTMPPPTETIKARFQKLPGGAYTAVFLVPMIAAGFMLTLTRNPAALLGTVALSMAIAIWMVDLSPWTYILPLLFGGSAALIGMQMGYNRQFGG